MNKDRFVGCVRLQNANQCNADHPYRLLKTLANPSFGPENLGHTLSHPENNSEVLQALKTLNIDTSEYESAETAEVKAEYLRQYAATLAAPVANFGTCKFSNECPLISKPTLAQKAWRFTQNLFRE